MIKIIFSHLEYSLLREHGMFSMWLFWISINLLLFRQGKRYGSRKSVSCLLTHRINGLVLIEEVGDGRKDYISIRVKLQITKDFLSISAIPIHNPLNVLNY